jgi:hypothetical protein
MVCGVCRRECGPHGGGAGPVAAPAQGQVPRVEAQPHRGDRHPYAHVSPPPPLLTPHDSSRLLIDLPSRSPSSLPMQPCGGGGWRGSQPAAAGGPLPLPRALPPHHPRPHPAPHPCPPHTHTGTTRPPSLASPTQRSLALYIALTFHPCVCVSRCRTSFLCPPPPLRVGPRAPPLACPFGADRAAGQRRATDRASKKDIACPDSPNHAEYLVLYPSPPCHWRVHGSSPRFSPLTRALRLSPP